jgi:type II secretory pathway component PulF
MNLDNNSELAGLKNQVFVLLVALIVVSGTVTVYLYRQASLAGKDLTQGQQLSDMLSKNEMVVQNFITKLVAFGEKHPDFSQQVLKKYGIAPVAGVPANAMISPAAAPAAPKK